MSTNTITRGTTPAHAKTSTFRTKTALALVLCALAATSACTDVGSEPWDETAEEEQVSEAEQEIIGGTDLSALAQNSGIVRIDGDGRCSGTLVREDWVLTADHCIDVARDQTFDNDGKALTTYAGETTHQGRAVASAPGDKVVVAGSVGGNRFAVVRYMPDGSLDPSFDGDGTPGNGRIATDFLSSTAEEGRAVAVDMSGRIIVSGYATVNGQRQFAMTRYSSSTGALDQTFGNGGMVLTNFPSSTSEEAMSVALDSQGRVYAAGYATVNGALQIAAARYLSNGQLDTTYDGDGMVLAAISGATDASAHDAVIDASGRLVVAGFAVVSSVSRFAVMRFTTGGAPDAAFGGTGAVTSAFPGTISSEARGIAIDANNKILVTGGATVSGGETRIALARYSGGGNIDSTFDGDGEPGGGGDGRLLFDSFNSLGSFGHDIKVDGDDHIWIAGRVVHNGSIATNMMTVLNVLPSGKRNIAWMGDGEKKLNFSSSDNESAWGIAIDANGQILLGGSAKVNGMWQIAAARLNSNAQDAPAPSELVFTMGTQSRVGDRAYTHPSVDAALIKLTQPFTGDGSAIYRFDEQWTGFYPYTNDSLVGETLACFGYGTNANGNIDNILRRAFLEVTSASDEGWYSVESGSLAGGDSGGPCLFNSQLTGITKTGASQFGAESFKVWAAGLLPPP